MLKRLILSVCICMMLTGCHEQSEPFISETGLQKFSAQIFSMDTVMDISIYSDNDALLDEAAALITDLDCRLSVTDKNSEIYTLNQSGSAVLSPETAALFEQSLHLCEKANGNLDISIYPIVKAWGFTSGAYRIPPQKELDALLQNVDYKKISFSARDRSVSLPEKMEIDFGSVAKGYAGDVLMQMLRENGISSALLNLGGNVHALGSKPDGSPWRIGIRDPEKDSYLGIVSIADKAVITSGGYERFFKAADGNIYWHIMDPATGFPAGSDLLSVTAVGADGIYCDALSTALFVMGQDKAIKFWQKFRDFDMILVSENNEILITPDLVHSFTLAEDSSYKLTVIGNA